MSKPVVYIASPYTKGDPLLNTRSSIECWKRLRDSGLVTPYSPLAESFMVHMLQPMSYGDWLEHCLEKLARCDAMLRIHASYKPLGYEQKESNGADTEEQYCTNFNKPVFYDEFELYSWAKHVYRPVPLASRQLPKHEAGTL